MVQTAASRSTSAQVALRTSLVRVAVRMRNCERERGHALLLAQLGHELAYLRVGQGGVMFDPLDFGAGRQELVEMATPAGRVVAVPEAANRRPIENGFNAAAEAGGGFGLGPPDRLERLGDERHVDRLDGQVAEDRIGVGRERRGPLCRVLVVFPTLAVRVDIGLGALAERSWLLRRRVWFGGVGRRGGARLGRCRVGAELAAFGGAFAGFGEREGMCGAEADFA